MNKCGQVLEEVGEGVRFPGARDSGMVNSLSQVLELTSRPLQDQLGLSATESLPQP